jgi:pimeloyl-ACP methyl ester carboxylesterase
VEETAMPMVATRNAEIYYETAGTSGPWITFAHGRGGNAASWWQQVPHFMSGYRTLAFEHRCFGRSRCDFKRDFAVEHFADDLLAILDAEGIDRTAIVAQSMGGWTGLGLALKHPERVTALALCDTTGGIETPESAALRAAMQPTPARIGDFSTLALAPSFPQRHPDLAFLYRSVQAFNTGFDYAAPSTLGDPRTQIRPEQLEGYRIPTLVLAGGEDQIFSPDLLRHIAATIPGARFELLPGLGHSAYFEDAAQFNAVVGDFLATHVK